MTPITARSPGSPPVSEREIRYPMAQVRTTEVELHGEGPHIFRHWLEDGDGITQLVTDDLEALRDLVEWALERRGA